MFNKSHPLRYMTSGSKIQEKIFCRILILSLGSVFLTITAWKVSKYGFFSDPYFPVFGLNTEIYILNLDTSRSEWGRKYTFLTIFLSTYEQFDSIFFFFSGRVWIDKLHDCHKRICFPNNLCCGDWEMSRFQLS